METFWRRSCVSFSFFLFRFVIFIRELSSRNEENNYVKRTEAECFSVFPFFTPLRFQAPNFDLLGCIFPARQNYRRCSNSREGFKSAIRNAMNFAEMATGGSRVSSPPFERNFRARIIWNVCSHSCGRAGVGVHSRRNYCKFTSLPPPPRLSHLPFDDPHPGLLVEPNR